MAFLGVMVIGHGYAATTATCPSTEKGSAILAARYDALAKAKAAGYTRISIVNSDYDEINKIATIVADAH